MKSLVPAMARRSQASHNPTKHGQLGSPMKWGEFVIFCGISLAITNISLWLGTAQYNISLFNGKLGKRKRIKFKRTNLASASKSKSVLDLPLYLISVGNKV